MPNAETLKRELVLLAPIREPKIPKTLWTASMLNKCFRIQILNAQGISIELSPYVKRKLSMATGAHNEVINWIAQKYSPIEREKYIKDEELRCGGHIDVVIYCDKTAFLIEVKTSQFFKQAPKYYWDNQVSFYYNTLKKLMPDKIIVPFVIVAGWNGDLQVLEPTITDEYIDILNQLNMYWDSGVLPPMPEKCESDCPLKAVCTEPTTTIDEYTEMARGFIYGQLAI